MHHYSKVPFNYARVSLAFNFAFIIFPPLHIGCSHHMSEWWWCLRFCGFNFVWNNYMQSHYSCLLSSLFFHCFYDVKCWWLVAAEFQQLRCCCGRLDSERYLTVHSTYCTLETSKQLSCWECEKSSDVLERETEGSSHAYADSIVFFFFFFFF